MEMLHPFVRGLKNTDGPHLVQGINAFQLETDKKSIENESY